MIDPTGIAVSADGRSNVVHERLPPCVGASLMMEITASQTGSDTWKIGLAARGTGHRARGQRPHYHPCYCAGFVTNPDGHNIQAVRHLPE